MALDAGIDRELFRDIAVRLADPEWIARVSDAITEAIHRELPELSADEQIRPATLASTLSVLRVWAELVQLDRPPDEAELPPAAVSYARELAQRGLSIDTLLRAYQVGNATFFEMWVQRIRAAIDDPDTRTHAVAMGARWTFAFVEALSRQLVARHAEEREAWVRSAVAMRTEIIRAILDGEAPEIRAASQRLRYELDREHLAYVVWSDENSAAGALVGELERIAGEVAQSLCAPGQLVVPLGGTLVAGWVPAPAGGVPQALRLDQTRARACVALGTSGRGVIGFAESHREAMHARRVARLAGRRAVGVIRFEDVDLVALASLDIPLAARFVRAHLGPLAAQDDDTLRLSSTLRVYLEEQASPRRTAGRLGVHENTVKARMRAIGELLPDPGIDRPAELLVALRLARVTERFAVQRSA